MKNTLLNKFLQKTIPPRVDLKFKRLKPFIKGSKVLDIGCGNGGFSLKLMQEGFDVTPLDIQDKSAFEQIKPLVFDGKKLPFADNTFDTALLITVLHHTTAQKELISEALRAARQVLIMEDVYGNALQKQVTFWMDSLVNWEWQGHPHSNRSHEQWMAYFQEFDCKVEFVQSKSTALFFRQNVYLLS